MKCLSQDSIIAIIGALIADELATLRPSDEQLWKGRQSHPDTMITTRSRARGESNEIEVDSFEWISIASRVVEFFQLDSSGVEDYLLRVSSLAQWAEVVTASRTQGSRDITFSTSGSTGKAKKCVQRWDNLVLEAEYFAHYFANIDAPVTRLISAVPPHHIYGFIFSVLLPEVLNVPVMRGLKAFSLTQRQALSAGDLIVGFPSWYQQLAQAQTEFAEGVNAVCSSGPVAGEVLQRLQQHGLAEVIEVYGSSETSGLGVRRERGGWYKLLPRWQKKDAEHLTDIAMQAAVALPDEVDWLDESHFRPLARIDHAVQVNGYNVYPKRIAAVIAEHRLVKTARVRLHEHDGGTSLKALMVPSQDARLMPVDEIIAQVREALMNQLARIEVPRTFTVASHVPLNDMGKETDWDPNADLIGYSVNEG